MKGHLTLWRGWLPREVSPLITDLGCAYLSVHLYFGVGYFGHMRNHPRIVILGGGGLALVVQPEHLQQHPNIVYVLNDHKENLFD